MSYGYAPVELITIERIHKSVTGNRGCRTASSLTEACQQVSLIVTAIVRRVSPAASG